MKVAHFFSNESGAGNMRLSGIANRAKHVFVVVKREGVKSLWRNIRTWTGFYDAAERQWRNHQFAVDQLFDTQHGVQTGLQGVFDLKVKGDNRHLAIAHVACDPDEFEVGMAAANIDYSQFTFIDLGSGKGRALMLAARHPFRRIIGVEFAEELHRAAEENFRRLAAVRGQDKRIELVHEDASEYPLPEEPLLIFLYHPFGEELMRKVAAKVLASYRLSPRKICIAYLNHVFENAWTEAGYQVAARAGAFAILTPPNTD
jgi:SAM-dependent methyltransferase